MAEAPVKRRKRNVASREEVYKALRRAGFDKVVAVRMTAVAGTESAYDLGVVRPSTASGTGGNNMHGLFQISDIHKGTSWWKKYGEDWDDIDNQAKMAKAVYDAQGLDKYSWASYGTPAYHQELKKAFAAGKKAEGEGIGKPEGKPERDPKKDKGEIGEAVSRPKPKEKGKGKGKGKKAGKVPALNDNQMILLGAVAVVVLLVVMKK